MIILKIIGIAFLVLLGLVLLLFLLLFFVPARYRGFFDKKEDGLSAFHGVLKINWLYPVLRIRVRYEENKVVYFVKIFWFILAGSDKKQKPKRMKKEPHKNEKRKTEPEKEKEFSSKESTEKTRTVTKAIEEKEDAGKEEQQNQVNENKLLKRIKRIINRIKDIFTKLKKIPVFLKELFRKRDLLKELIEDEICKAAFQTGFLDLKKLLRHIRPRDLKGAVEFGTGEPDGTGKLLAAACIFYSYYGRRVTLTPDFEKRKLYVSLRFRGRVRMIHFLTRGIHFYFHKNTKKLKTRYRRFHEDWMKKTA